VAVAAEDEGGCSLTHEHGEPVDCDCDGGDAAGVAVLY
jgi:hypothetical protein